MRFKRLAAAVLAAVMLIGLLPGTAFAAGCADGAHDLSGALQAPNYTECSGGVKVPFRVCQSCWLPFDENGNSPEWYEGTGIHTPEYFHAADYTPCTGGYTEDVYQCTVCEGFCSATGGELQYTQGTGVHTPEFRHEADYTPCTGGFTEDVYECTICGYPCNAAGSELWYTPGTGAHQFGELQAPDYTPCGGGFKESFYHCELCNSPWLADGVTQPVWYEGTGAHQIGEMNDPNWNSCGGGFKVPFAECQLCGQPVDENGNGPEWFPGNGEHTLEYRHEANYIPCRGGFTEDVYECTGCGNLYNADGGELQYTPGTGAHQFGELQAPDYTPCGGGFKESFYHCELCNSPWLADGVTQPVWYEGTGAHQCGELQAPNYTECGGGFKVPFAECQLCGQPVDENGNGPEWFPGNGEHTLEYRHEADYTPCDGGFTEDVYECTTCRNIYNANGGELQSRDPLGHDLVRHEAQAPTCDRVGWQAYESCSRCGYSNQTAALWSWEGHNYLASVVVTQPTCTEDGYAVYTCCFCGDSYTGAYDPNAATFQSELSLLGETEYFEYKYDYIYNDTTWQYQSLLPEGAWDGYVTIPGDYFELSLSKHFVLSDAELAEFREYLNSNWGDAGYDAEAHTYTIFVGGGVGGSLDPRAYGGYVKNADGTYNVYYPTVTYGEYLSEYMEDANRYVEELGWPSTLEYNGMTFVPTPSEYGYIRVLGYGNTGRMIHVELNGNLVRIISCTDDVAMPAAYDDATGKALGHAMGGWTVTVPSTTTANGVKTRTCVNGCGKTESESIPALTLNEGQSGASIDPEGTQQIIVQQIHPLTAEETVKRDEAIVEKTEGGYAVAGEGELLLKDTLTGRMTEGDLDGTFTVDLTAFFGNMDLSGDVHYVLLHYGSEHYGSNCSAGMHEHPVAADGTVQMDGLSPVWLMVKAGPAPAPSTPSTPAAPGAPAAPSVPTSPKTSDSTPVLLWSALMAVSFGGMVLLRKRKDEE